MFAFKALTTVLALVSSAVVHATPLAMGRRDVIAPKIIKPDASSVWPVGSVQTVTWDTSNFPPDSQITNPIGKVILGFDENDSLNLDFNHPLAEGFKLRDGSVKLTVPNVPPRNDYLIVLFGDSGNTSPSFAITRIQSGGNNSSSSAAPSPPPASSSQAPVSPTESLNNAPTPITGSATTDGSPNASPSRTPADSSVAALPTSTSPSAAASDDAANSPAPTPLAANTGAGISIHGSLNLNVFIVSMTSMLALVVL
ncbi:hypothetical protein BJ165DRAFT_1404165 [Panaeolus papilionaceus]|nr:hypothetical protein BJ165DRAFT_1404165 [Panaeolus papilionaceus]